MLQGQALIFFDVSKIFVLFNIEGELVKLCSSPRQDQVQVCRGMCWTKDIVIPPKGNHLTLMMLPPLAYSYICLFTLCMLMI